MNFCSSICCCFFACSFSLVIFLNKLQQLIFTKKNKQANKRKKNKRKTSNGKQVALFDNKKIVRRSIISLCETRADICNKN